MNILPILSLFANTAGAISTMQQYVTPTIQLLAAIAAIACTFFIVNAGYLYMTSRGQPDKLQHAKHILRNALLGLVIVLGAATLTSMLSGAYSAPQDVTRAALPNLQAIDPEPVSNGLVDVLINAVVGFLNTIIQAVAAPFLAALNFFTTETPLMVSNPSVFNLWLAVVGITDVLFIVILALVGLHVMSAASFGFDEIEIKHLLPRIGLIFLLLNSSIFLIDGVIELSNVLIDAIGKVSGASSVWDTLTAIVAESGGQGLAGLLMMLVFLIFSVMLLVYYVGRIVTLYVGAVISPLVLLVWLVPGFRDFSETAAKTYLTTVFVLFVHVIILLLAASLFTGMSAASNNDVPNALMGMTVGLATVVALLKTQGVMMQFSYVSMGARNARMLGGQFMNGVSYLTGKGKGAVTKVASTGSSKRATASTSRTTSVRTGASATKNGGVTVTRTPAASSGTSRPKTGTTYEAPKSTPITPTPRSSGKENVK